MRRFWDRRSSAIEVNLVITHSHWLDKANTPYMEYVVYICFKIFFAWFACQQYLKTSKFHCCQTHCWRYWFRLSILALLNINSNLKRHDMDTMYILWQIYILKIKHNKLRIFIQLMLKDRTLEVQGCKWL